MFFQQLLDQVSYRTVPRTFNLTGTVFIAVCQYAHSRMKAPTNDSHFTHTRMNAKRRIVQLLLATLIVLVIFFVLWLAMLALV
jgi:hypothetical protein